MHSPAVRVRGATTGLVRGPAKEGSASHSPPKQGPYPDGRSRDRAKFHIAFTLRAAASVRRREGVAGTAGYRDAGAAGTAERRDA